MIILSFSDLSTTFPPFYAEKPINCWDNATADNANFTLGNKILLLLSTYASDCYPHLDKEEKNSFLKYEEIVGGYCNCIVGCLGIIGNLRNHGCRKVHVKAKMHT